MHIMHIVQSRIHSAYPKVVNETLKSLCQSTRVKHEIEGVNYPNEEGYVRSQRKR